MSGTSLDGLDLVATKFTNAKRKWSFEILDASTKTYPDSLIKDLRNAINWEENEIKGLDQRLGQFIGEAAKQFSKTLESNVDFISSHGHTIFHKPEEGYTLQIGDARMISEISMLPVINNFRVNDVKLGGQGAPLVPIGDRDLFADYDFCLNLGGIANVSFDDFGKRVAYDICPFNMGLNDLANELGLEFDDGGRLARLGETDESLLNTLNEIYFLEKRYPKSLGLENYRDLWYPILGASRISVHDKMRTYVEHVAQQISKELNSKDKGRVLVTGGGTFHEFFMSRLKQLSDSQICVPNSQIINFKEALVFAYLGLLRYLNVPNCLSSVTGATKDNSGGDLYGFDKSIMKTIA